MNIAASALKHGISEDIRHAVRNALVTVDQAGRVPERTLVIGLARSGKPLEVVILRPESDPQIIHAMDLREKFRPYVDDALPGGDREPTDRQAGARRRSRRAGGTR